MRLPGQGLHKLIRYFDPDAEEDQQRDEWSLFELSVDPGALGVRSRRLDYSAAGNAARSAEAGARSDHRCGLSLLLGSAPA